MDSKIYRKWFRTLNAVTALFLVSGNLQRHKMEQNTNEPAELQL